MTQDIFDVGTQMFCNDERPSISVCVGSDLPVIFFLKINCQVQTKHNMTIDHDQNS
jgi:hypothetical protein